MTVFENINSKNIDELVEWLDRNGAYECTPWERWFDKTYCRKCGALSENGHEFAWCELHGNCKYFKDMKKIPNRKQMIRLWLESESN